jgi:hypothetical protein
MTVASSPLIPFGKHRGVSLETVLSIPGHANYPRWLIAQTWVQTSHPALYSAARSMVLAQLQSEIAAEAITP